MSTKEEFLAGVKGGIPIALGYLPVSFTFGLIAVSGGLPVWVACLISLTNLTSAGQMAALTFIYIEMQFFKIKESDLRERFPQT